MMTEADKAQAKRLHRANTAAWKLVNAERNTANVKRWKAEHPKAVREANRKAQATWRQRQKAQQILIEAQTTDQEAGQ